MIRIRRASARLLFCHFANLSGRSAWNRTKIVGVGDRNSTIELNSHIGVPDRIRTCDLLLKRQLRYLLRHWHISHGEGYPCVRCRTSYCEFNGELFHQLP